MYIAIEQSKEDQRNQREQIFAEIKKDAEQIEDID